MGKPWPLGSRGGGGGGKGGGGGGEVPVDGRDVVRLVGGWVEVMAEVGQGQRVDSVSDPGRKGIRKPCFSLERDRVR